MWSPPLKLGPGWRRRFVLVLVGLLSTGAAGAWFVAGVLVSPARDRLGDPPDDMRLEATTLTASSGARIATWYRFPPESRATVVVAHGVYANRRAMLPRARALLEQGWGVVLIDLQGHGESSGEAITLGHLERHDVAAAVAFVKARQPEHRIGVIGISLGGAAAIGASPMNVDAIVVEGTFSTAQRAIHNRVAKRAGPLALLLTPLLTCQLPWRLGVHVAELQPIAQIQRCGCPLLVANGTHDPYTPVNEARELFEAAREPKLFVTFPDAPHVDLYAHNPTLYRETILPFLAEQFGDNAASEASP